MRASPRCRACPVRTFALNIDSGSHAERTRFEALADALGDAGASAGAAGCHGTLCGMLCAAPQAEPRLWLEQVLGRTAGPADAGCVAVLQRELERTVAELCAADFAFDPLLPGDQRPLVERLRALREWCEGFLFGFGALSGSDLDAQPPATREFVADLVELSRLDDRVAAAGEAEEAAYMELVEYVKVGTLGARTEQLARAAGEPRRGH